MQHDSFDNRCEITLLRRPQSRTNGKAKLIQEMDLRREATSY